MIVVIMYLVKQFLSSSHGVLSLERILAESFCFYIKKSWPFRKGANILRLPSKFVAVL